MDLLRMPFLTAAAVLLAGCGLGASVSESSDPYSDGEPYSRSVSFESLDRFEEAQRLVAARDFAGAIAIYRNLYQTDPDREVEARALLEWAKAEHSPFNPDRSADAARARLQMLLEDYPDSAVAPEAAEVLDGISD